jgi:hypothetical protein
VNSAIDGKALTWWLARQNRQRQSLRPDTSGSGLRRYELMKRQWITANPGSTPEAYSRAMQEIASKCGV